MIGPARVATVLEGATGFTFLALIIGYIPAIFAGFSRREVAITLLDGRAGSPPSALAVLTRHGRLRSGEPLSGLLRAWETWAADLLQNHLSYPILAYFRSQHEGQSWLAALTMMLDTSALLVVGISHLEQPSDQAQARHTFAIARHAAGDLSQVLDTMPRRSGTDRLSRDDLARLRAELAASGLPLRGGEAADRQLAALRGLYEPYVAALAEYLLVDLPPWIPAPDAVDDWETTAWEYDYRLARAALEPRGSEAGADTA